MLYKPHDTASVTLPLLLMCAHHAVLGCHERCRRRQASGHIEATLMLYKWQGRCAAACLQKVSLLIQALFNVYVININGPQLTLGCNAVETHRWYLVKADHYQARDSDTVSESDHHESLKPLQGLIRTNRKQYWNLGAVSERLRWRILLMRQARWSV